MFVGVGRGTAVGALVDGSAGAVDRSIELSSGGLVGPLLCGREGLHHSLKQGSRSFVWSRRRRRVTTQTQNNSSGGATLID